MLTTGEFEKLKTELKKLKKLNLKTLFSFLEKNYVQDFENPYKLNDKKACLFRPKTDNTPKSTDHELKRGFKVRTAADSLKGDEKQ